MVGGAWHEPRPYGQTGLLLEDLNQSILSRAISTPAVASSGSTVAPWMRAGSLM